jgi:hypothetical protein
VNKCARLARIPIHLLDDSGTPRDKYDKQGCTLASVLRLTFALPIRDWP